MKFFKKILTALLIIGFMGLITLKGIKPAWQNVNSDFANYYVSAKLVSDNAPLEQLYDNDWFQGKMREYGVNGSGKFAPFPPITAFIMIPLTSFSPLEAQRIFTIINLFFVGLAIFALRKITNWSWTACTLLLFSSGLGLINNIAFGQVYLIITTGVLFAYIMVNENRPWAAAIILAAFTSLKYFPIVFVAGYLLVGLIRQNEGMSLNKNVNLKTGMYAVLIVIALGVFQFLFFGKHVITEFIQSSFVPHLNGDLHGQNPYSYQFQSWQSLLKNLFTYDPTLNPHPWIDSQLLKTFLIILIVMVIGSAMMFVLYRFRNRPDKEVIFLSVPALAALTILPASATYHFILLLIPIGLLLTSPIFSRTGFSIILLIFGCIGFVPYHLFAEAGVKWCVLLAYPRLGLMTLLYFVIITECIRYLRVNNNSI